MRGYGSTKSNGDQANIEKAKKKLGRKEGRKGTKKGLEQKRKEAVLLY